MNAESSRIDNEMMSEIISLYSLAVWESNVKYELGESTDYKDS